MTRGGGMGKVFAGIFCVALGAGLTYLSYQLATPGGVYFVFVGLIGSGFLMIFRGLMTPGATNGKRRGYARSAQSPMGTYVASPEQMPPGFCWECGRKVRAGNTVCFGCGATHVRAATSHQAGSTASRSGWDLSADASSGAKPWEQPAPRSGAAYPQQWSQTAYRPDAPSPW